MIEAVNHHENGTPLLHSCEFAEVEIIFFDDSSAVVFEEPVQLERNCTPIDQFHPFSQLFLLLSADQLFGLGCFILHGCAAGWAPASLIFVNEKRIIFIGLSPLLEATVLAESTVLYFRLVLDLIDAWPSEAVRSNSANRDVTLSQILSFWFFEDGNLVRCIFLGEMESTLTGAMLGLR